MDSPIYQPSPDVAAIVADNLEPVRAKDRCREACLLALTRNGRDVLPDLDHEGWTRLEDALDPIAMAKRHASDDYAAGREPLMRGMNGPEADAYLAEFRRLQTATPWMGDID